MNTEQNLPESDRPDRPGRPFGFWLKLVDRRLSEEMAELFADEGLSRRDWRALNLLAGSASDEQLAARLDARPQLLHRLAERGWLEPTGDEPHRPGLNDAGRDARECLQSRVDELRSRVAGVVSDEDFATTLRTLEAIARELGWDESQPLPRGRRGGRRFAEGRGHDHGHGHGDPRHGTGDEREHGGRHPGHPCDHERHHHGRRGNGRGRDVGPARPGFGPRGDVQVHIHVHG